MSVRYIKEFFTPTGSYHIFRVYDDGTYDAWNKNKNKWSDYDMAVTFSWHPDTNWEQIELTEAEVFLELL